MSKNFLLFLLIGLLCFSATAQEFKITGKITDSLSNLPIEAATVFIETMADSTLVTYTITERNGNFELNGRTGNSKVNLYISFVGYSAYDRVIDLSKNRNLNLGTIPLSQQVENLGDVTIRARRAPVTIKKDTLEFNVGSFNTKKDANVEDLLKELPGVEVDAQGNITVNGKPVNKILVNGKPFFGNDPTIATRNLTKEIVEKIQVTDTKSDSEAFTGEEGDGENKTINITIDKEKNKGIFGRVAGGVGTDKRFEYAGLLNYFDNDLRISVLGGGNNINSPGFSFGEIQKMFGSSFNYVSISGNGAINIDGRSFGGGEGISNSRTVGANYADNLGKKTEISSDYFYSAYNAYKDEEVNREYTLPNNKYFSSSNSQSENFSDNHSLNLKLKHEVDSTFLIEDRPRFTYTKGEFNNERAEFTFDSDSILTNQSTSRNSTIQEGVNFENNLTATKKFGANGAFLKLNVKNELNKTDNDNYLTSETLLVENPENSVIRDQFTNGKNSLNGLELKGEWRIPLVSKKVFMDVSYGFIDRDREDKKFVYDLNPDTNNYSNFNFQQSTNFSNTNRELRPEIGFTYNTDTIHVSISSSLVSTTLNSEDLLRNTSFENKYDNLEINSRLRYQFSKKTGLYLGYNKTVDAPQIRELSPYTDVSNPLNIITGNPDLSPEKRQSIYLNLNSYDFQKRTGIYSYVNFYTSKDKVVQTSIIDSNFIRRTTYANVDNTYQLYGNINYSKEIELDSLRSFKYGTGFSINGNRSINFNNNIQYASNTITYSPTVSLVYNWKNFLEVKTDYSLNYTDNTIDLTNFEDRKFTRHEVRLRTKLNFLQKAEWNNDIKYNYNSNVAAGFQKDAMFWNSSLLYSFYQDKFTASLKVYDLLNQNTNSRRYATEDYIQDSQSTVLQRYVMFGLSYKFNTLGKKGETGDGGFWFD